MKRIDRVINVRFHIDDLHFDAAIDPDWQMHAYGAISLENKESTTPIEIYCFDHPEWDILMLYQTKDDAYSCHPVNEQQEKYEDSPFGGICFTACDFNKIIEETKKWIEDNK